MTALFVMNSSVTAPAKREEILQRIVPQLFGRSDSSSVNVMNVQVFSNSAPLASEVVTLQCALPVAAKVIVVKCFAPVLIPLRILGKRPANLLDTAFLQASKAVLLWTRTVDEIGITLNALKRGANCYSAFLFPQFTQMQHILFLPVRRPASIAALLGRAGRLVEHLADEALTLFKAVASLPVSSQRTRFASLQVGRCLWHLRSAIGAIEDAVFPRFHNLNYELSPL
jgi:hypothetical protein